jgi:hypothetical protein
MHEGRDADEPAEFVAVVPDVKEDQRRSTSIDVIVQAAAVDIRPTARSLMLERSSNDRGGQYRRAREICGSCW